MSEIFINISLLAVSVSLMGYLLVTLIFPERF